MLVLPKIEEPAEYNANYIFYWNYAGLQLNRMTHSINGPQGGPTLSSRILGILHLAIHDAYFALRNASPYPTYLSSTVANDSPYKLPDPLGITDNDDNLADAVAGAAITVLGRAYTRPGTFSFSITDQLQQMFKQLVDEYPAHTGRRIDTLSSGYQFGLDVGVAISELLAIKSDEPGADQGQYRPQESGRYAFRDEPSNPVRLTPINPNDPDGPKRAVRIYHAPYYGMTAKRFAVQMQINGSAVEHIIADPPKDVGGSAADATEYIAAAREVHALGGAPTLNTTLRTADQTVAAYYWAYDGANLIGTPPRLYNQIIRKVAWNNSPAGATDETKNDEFVRLFALVNTAMADAGIFSWREKYCFEFWRPLPGIREHDSASGPGEITQSGNENLDDVADPFWLTLGAPETNTDKISFKPPFPAYPSGHATFGAACFQIARLYYKKRDNLTFKDDEPDNISFDFVSEELNGVSRDLRQPYEPNVPITEQSGVVRTRVVRNFKNLWAAIFENAASRVWLGVHWRFDAFAAKDAIKSTKPNGVTVYKDSDQIKYKTRGKRADRPGNKTYPIGGAPLGIEIANDIFNNGVLTFTPPDKQPIGRNKCGLEDLLEDLPSDQVEAEGRQSTEVNIKATQTNIR